MSEETNAPDQAPGYSWYALGVLFLVYLFNFVDRQILSIPVSLYTSPSPRDA